MYLYIKILIIIIIIAVIFFEIFINLLGIKSIMYK